MPTELGQITAAVADAGYFSENNVSELPESIVAVIATCRETHNTYLETVLNKPAGCDQIDDGDLQIQSMTVIDQMKRRLKTPKYKAIYKKRKQTVEPVFGIIKSVLGFRQFSLRGVLNTDAEWSIICLAYNLKRMFKMYNSLNAK